MTSSILFFILEMHGAVAINTLVIRAILERVLSVYPKLKSMRS